MDITSMFSKILAAILGMIIIGSIGNLIIVLLLILYFIAFRPESISNTLYTIYSLTSLVIIIAGIYFGLKSHKTQNALYAIFKPSKNKIIISASLSLIFITLSIALGGAKTFVNIYAIKPALTNFSIPLALFSYFLAFYPFSALSNFIYQYRNDKLFKNSKILIIVFLIFLNPLFIVYGGAMGAIYRQGIVNEPCGINIDGFTEQSPAKNSGMQVNEIIVKMNDIEINSINNLLEYMENYQPSMGLIIHTKTNSYAVEPNLQNGRYLLGINLTQEMCKRSTQK